MMLSILMLILFTTALMALVAGKFSTNAPKWLSLIGLTTAGITLLPLLKQIPNTQKQWLVEESAAWIPRLNIEYHLAADALSLLLITLTIIVGIAAIIASWKESISKPGFFYFNILLTLTAVIGVFTAIDLFLFFVFWEVMLIPLYCLIVIWGKENRRYAAIKFFIFTQAGGLIMLACIITLASLHYQNTEVLSFNYQDLINTDMTRGTTFWLILGFFIAFAIKLPVLPFHAWQADTYAEAPTSVALIIAALLSKMGAFGLIRFVFPLFHEAIPAFAPIAILLALCSIIYGAVLAFSQTDFKRMIAYSSLSHMGFVLLGCFAATTLSLTGAIFQLLAHGISTAGLFLVAASIESRFHTTNTAKLGGVWQLTPRLAAFGFIFIAATVGIPGLGNFIAEFLILLGSFGHYPFTTALSATALILGAIYCLKMVQSLFFGPLKQQAVNTNDIDAREMIAFLILTILLLGMGLHPQWLIDAINSSLHFLPDTFELTHSVGAVL